MNRTCFSMSLEGSFLPAESFLYFLLFSVPMQDEAGHECDASRRHEKADQELQHQRGKRAVQDAEYHIPHQFDSPDSDGSWYKKY